MTLRLLPPPRRLGAVSLTPDLSSAATSLMTALASSCPTTAFDECSSFQQAYVDGGGSWVDLGISGTTPDGLYGPSTQAAFQTVLDAMAPSGTNPQTAPNACVGAGTNVPALAPTTAAGEPPVVPAGSVAIGPWVVSQQTLLITAAVGVALALVGSAVYKHYADQETLRGIRHAPAYARRRRNPSRARKNREKARERSYEMVRGKNGRFVRRARPSAAEEE